MCPICVLDYRLAKTELRLDGCEQLFVKLVQPEPNNAARLADESPRLIDGDVAHSPSIGTGHNRQPTLAQEICAFEADDVENLSQRYANDGYARRVRAARCHGPTGSDWS